jgi:hypothetical protein
VTAPDKFTKWLGEELLPWFEERDFRLKDTTFRRRRGDDWQIVNVQRDKYSNARVVPFTVNLGVALTVLRGGEPLWGPRGWPLEYECDFRARLGEIAYGEDAWWRIRSYWPARRVTRQVLGGLEDVGLPWLDLHVDERRLLSELVADPSAVGIMNLGAFVSLAEAIGTDTEVAVARRERDAFKAGER